MNEKDMRQIKESIIMPPEMADTLLQNCTQSHKISRIDGVRLITTKRKLKE